MNQTFPYRKLCFVCILSLTILLKPASHAYAQNQDKAVQLFAHRGGAHEQDENTLQAFQNTYEKGLRGFETDVRITKDGQMVIMHDANLERTTTGKGIIEEMTAAELHKVKTKKGNPLLFLDDLLKYFKNKPGVYLEFEMKTTPATYPQELLEKYCDQLYKTLMDAKPQHSTYLMTSFDKRPLKYLKTKYPDVDLLYITSAPCSKETIQEVLDLGIKRIGCGINGTSRKSVKEAQAAGILVSCWPGHSVADFQLGMALGCDYLCSDVPVEVLTWMTAKMPWVKIK